MSADTRRVKLSHGHNVKSRSQGASMFSGHCNCGAVSFEFDGTPAGVYVCHCSICRRSSGANGMAVVLVPNEQFRWTKGTADVVQWSKPQSQWDTWFCRYCGSRVPGKNDNDRMFVPAGLLPGADLGLKVQAHIWVDSRAEWDEIGDCGVQHSQRYGSGVS
jgi:hypothetical protein